MLDRLKVERGITDEKAAGLLNVGATYLSQIRTGRRNAGYKLITKIESVLSGEAGKTHIIDLTDDEELALRDVCKMSRNPADTIIHMAISYYTKLAKLKKSLPWEPDLKDIAP